MRYILSLDFASFKPKMMVQSREICPGLRQRTGTKKGTVSLATPGQSGHACLLLQGQPLRPGTPPPPARIAWHPPFDSLFPHHDLQLS